MVLERGIENLQNVMHFSATLKESGLNDTLGKLEFVTPLLLRCWYYSLVWIWNVKNWTNSI